MDRYIALQYKGKKVTFVYISKNTPNVEVYVPPNEHV